MMNQSKWVRLAFVLWSIAYFLPGYLFGQDASYPPGTLQMTPEIDLGLEAVSLEVPDEFRDLVADDLQLFLPPGFFGKSICSHWLKGATDDGF